MIFLPGHLKLFILKSELKNADVESLTTQDVKLIKRNLLKARASILLNKITSHFFGITLHF